MLDILEEVEKALPHLLSSQVGWKTVFVNYDFPQVERIWRPWYEYRVYLHRLLPCGSSEAGFHPHPWPAAMLVCDGSYEMLVGHGPGENPPPTASRLILAKGSRYEMVDRDAWHSVRPIDRPAISLMVSGKPWKRPVKKSSYILPDLAEDKFVEIFDFFRQAYP